MRLTFHHIGVACRELESETQRLQALGYERESADFIDPIQGVNGRFLVGGGRVLSCSGRSREVEC